jgi:hypothetical protein
MGKVHGDSALTYRPHHEARRLRVVPGRVEIARKTA